MIEGPVEVPGGRVWTLRWQDCDGPWLLFAHATGMCAAVYRALLEPLADRYRIAAFDARGHGRTDLPMVDSPDWAVQRADMAALARALTPDPVVLAGHSFGGSVAAQSAADHPGLARAVVMIEPAFIPFAHAEAYAAARAAAPNRMADQAARRRPAFPTRAEMRAAYLGRGVFAGWPDVALDAYLDGGARATPDGYALRCAPATEARTFRGVTTTLADSMRRLAAAGVPMTLLHAGADSTVTPADAVAMAATRVHRFDDAGHFVPVTHADAVRPWLAV